jgi:hypothetical protein
LALPDCDDRHDDSADDADNEWVDDDDNENKGDDDDADDDDGKQSNGGGEVAFSDSWMGGSTGPIERPNSEAAAAAADDECGVTTPIESENETWQMQPQQKRSRTSALKNNNKQLLKMELSGIFRSLLALPLLFASSGSTRAH